ncbi:hypothetical protein HanHA89_Chr10g0400191 [Helianthus annuus]|nr:hypothetical protein HanHA89_Chr10g0400191 [Helianthus annuus]
MKTLMMSLQDEEGSSARNPVVASPVVPNHTSLSSHSNAGENDENVPLPPLSKSPITSQSSDVLNFSQDEPVTDGQTFPLRVSKIDRGVLQINTF